MSVVESTHASSPPHGLDQHESGLPFQIHFFGLYVFFAVAVMLFAGFTSAYIIRMASRDAIRIHLPGVLWISTVVLVISSLFLEWSYRTKHERTQNFTLILATVFGTGFLIVQYAGWKVLLSQGVDIVTTPHASFFYILTAIHGAHVVSGLVVLGVLLVRRIRKKLNKLHFGLGRTYWHFLALLWIYLFALLHLI